MPTEPLHLVDSHEWSGLWWLPDAPDERVPGVLRYDRDGGAELTLIGTFEDRVMTSPRPGVTHVHEGTRSWDVILGVAEKREITLLGCIPTSTNRSFGARVKSPDKQVVSAQSALIGVHAANTEAALFEGLQISRRGRRSLGGRRGLLVVDRRPRRDALRWQRLYQCEAARIDVGPGRRHRVLTRASSQSSVRRRASRENDRADPRHGLPADRSAGRVLLRGSACVREVSAGPDLRSRPIVLPG